MHLAPGKQDARCEDVRSFKRETRKFVLSENI